MAVVLIAISGCAGRAGQNDIAPPRTAPSGPQSVRPDSAPGTATANYLVPISLHFGIERYRLGNGLEVILSPDHSVPFVAVNVWYHVGSNEDPPGRAGFAHLF